MYCNYAKKTILVSKKLTGNKKTNTMQRFVPSRKPMHWNYANTMTSISWTNVKKNKFPVGTALNDY